MSTMTDTPVVEDQAEGGKKKGGKLKKLLKLVIVLAVVGGAAWFFVLKPEGEPAPPVPGEVLALEPLQVNLAGGHYLRLGIALQLVEGAAHADGSKALDAAIALFSGLEMSELAQPKQREELKAELEHVLDETYHHEVLGVYFTQFVTQ